MPPEDRRDAMIFDDVAEIMNRKPVLQIRRLTGLRKDRIYSLRCGCTFHLDYDLIVALRKMGYEIKVVPVSGKPDIK